MKIKKNEERKLFTSVHKNHSFDRGASSIAKVLLRFAVILIPLVFTKEQIYYAVWKEGYFLDESNIMAFIRKLRKKIETNPDSPEYILTVWGIGYKFVE